MITESIRFSIVKEFPGIVVATKMSFEYMSVILVWVPQISLSIVVGYVSF